MTVITNSGPLIALAKIGALGILEGAYGQCLAPSAVHDEVVLSGRKGLRVDADRVDAVIEAGALVILPVEDAELPSEISALPLDRGERQVIHLAMKQHANLVLLDDSRARSIAASLGLKVKGTLGVIVDGVRAGILETSEAIQLIESIRSRSDIWIADTVCDTVLARIKAFG